MKKTVLLSFFMVLYSLTVVAQPTNPPANAPSGKSWQVVNNLTDDFSSFNTNKWVKRNHDTGPEGHRWAGRKPGKFYTSQSTVSGGKLRITATADYNPGDAQTNCNFWIKTGFVYSKTKAQIGDYTECSMKASDLSMASSFWLKLGTENNQEIDVTETYGNGRNTRFWDDKIRSNTHFFQGGTDHASDPTPVAAGFKPREQFHRVGMHWKSATQMDIYVNGVYKKTINTKNGRQINEPLRLIWDMEAFVPACGSGPGAPDYDHIRPNNPTRRNFMEVDWVKTWRPVNATSGGGGNSSDAPIGKVIALKKNGGDFKWVTAEKGGSNQLIARATSIQGWEEYTVESHPKGGIALKAKSNGKYVQVQNKDANKPVRALGGFKGDWEHFEWKSKGDGKVALRSVHSGKWLQAAWNIPNAVVYPKGVADQGWETFQFVIRGGTNLTVSISDFEDTSFSIFPNPAVETLNIRGLSEEDALIKIIDMSGKAMAVEVIGTTINEKQLDIRNLPQGIYIIKAITSGEIIQETFIKK